MPERATQARPQGQAAPAAVDVVTAAAPDPVDPDVAELAALMGGPVNLVWETGDGGRHEVLLHVDGRIELPDGTVVGDVAEAAARLHGPVPDARAVWHVGDHHGPTLADLLT